SQRRKGSRKPLVAEIAMIPAAHSGPFRRRQAAGSTANPEGHLGFAGGHSRSYTGRKPLSSWPARASFRRLASSWGGPAIHLVCGNYQMPMLANVSEEEA